MLKFTLNLLSKNPFFIFSVTSLIFFIVLQFIKSTTLYDIQHDFQKEFEDLKHDAYHFFTYSPKVSESKRHGDNFNNDYSVAQKQISNKCRREQDFTRFQIDDERQFTHFGRGKQAGEGWVYILDSTAYTLANSPSGYRNDRADNGYKNHLLLVGRPEGEDRADHKPSKPSDLQTDAPVKLVEINRPFVLCGEAVRIFCVDVAHNEPLFDANNEEPV